MRIRFGLICMWLTVIVLPSASADSNRSELAPGLAHFTWNCKLDDRVMEFEELRWERGSPTELRAIPNPGATPNPNCRHGYGGMDLPTLVKSPQTIQGFKVLGATNGTLFRKLGRSYASNHLIWSKDTGLLAPLRRAGGTRIFVADGRGGHELNLRFVPCDHGPCARLSIGAKDAPYAGALNGTQLIAAIRAAFPTMTLAIQSNMPLSGGKMTARKTFSHYTRCPADHSGDWRCAHSARTILCARPDGSVSLITTPGAYPFDLANGLRPKGACHADCMLLYNLDGGGSTQMGYQNKTISWSMTGSAMETSQPGCSTYRPVDHYLGFGLRQ